MRWFRFYSEAMYDPKVISLRPALRWHWVAFLCLANANEVRGRVHSGAGLGQKWGIRGDKVGQIVARLCSAGLIEQDGEWLVPHGWNKRQMQSDNVAERVQKHRERNVTVTALDTEVDTDTEREEIRLLAPTPDKGAIFRIYEQAFGRGIPNETVARQLIQAEEDNGRDCLTHCFEAAGEAEIPEWRYVKKILERHQREGCDEWEGDDNGYKESIKPPEYDEAKEAERQKWLADLDARQRSRISTSPVSQRSG